MTSLKKKKAVAHEIMLKGATYGGLLHSRGLGLDLRGGEDTMMRLSYTHTHKAKTKRYHTIQVSD